MHLFGDENGDIIVLLLRIYNTGPARTVVDYISQGQRSRSNMSTSTLLIKACNDDYYRIKLHQNLTSSVQLIDVTW